MPTEALLELEKARLLWPETTKCYTKLTNGDDKPLSNINPQNQNASATIGVKNLATGEESLHARPLDTNESRRPVSLAPGESRDDSFDLSALFQFPSCGAFEFRAIFESNGQRIESKSIHIEVLPANPIKLLTTAKIGREGDIFCGWVNKDRGDTYSFWATLIKTSPDAKFVWSKQISTVPKGVTPYVSFPTDHMSARQYFVWVESRKLNYVVTVGDDSKSATVDLGEDGFEIVRPMLEGTSNHGGTNLEILLLKTSPDGSRMRVLSLGESPRFVEGPRSADSFEWLKTVSRVDGERLTFILLRKARDGVIHIRLTMSHWKSDFAPARPVFLSKLRGTLIAADVTISSGERIFGAALLKQETDGKIRFVIEKWHIDANFELILSTMRPLSWNEDWTIEEAVLRVNSEGTPFVLLKGGPESLWFWVDDAGDVNSIGELSSEINLPADIVFVGGSFPMILFTDKSCGLKCYG